MKCYLCKREMNQAAGCFKTYFELDGKRYEREPYAGGRGPDGRCGDCGAKVGHYHHPGCDTERCPICGGQLLGCACVDKAKEYRAGKR